jgi:hypothetical protein
MRMKGLFIQYKMGKEFFFPGVNDERTGRGQPARFPLGNPGPAEVL